MTAIFHGTAQETRELLDAIARWCTCPKRSGVAEGICSACQLVQDQRVLDGLLFTRRHEVPRIREQDSLAQLHKQEQPGPTESHQEGEPP